MYCTQEDWLHGNSNLEKWPDKVMSIVSEKYLKEVERGSHVYSSDASSLNNNKKVWQQIDSNNFELLCPVNNNKGQAMGQTKENLDRIWLSGCCTIE